MVTLKVAMRGYYFVIDSFPVKAFFSFFERNETKRKESRRLSFSSSPMSFEKSSESSHPCNILYNKIEALSLEGEPLAFRKRYLRLLFLPVQWKWK